MRNTRSLTQAISNDGPLGPEALQRLLSHIRQSLLGEGSPLNTPFGVRPLVYADYTASGRGLSFIEEYLRTQVLPFYANTHTETSATGLQTTKLREEARDLIRHSLKGGDDAQVIFTGAGATAAINKLIDILQLRLPRQLDDRYGFSGKIPEEQRPVVFIGPYEHHSNELPWRESIAEVHTVPFDAQGQLDLAVLEQGLERYKNRPLLIGSFSAASNVTGLLSDTKAVSRLLHRYGALSCWDYAAAAPYVDIDMASEGEPEAAMDALFISPHKLVGGPGTPGLLVIDKALLSNTVPAVPGGGTVSWVSPDSHCYLPAGERREEGGTPAIMESIRAGMVFQLKDAVGAHNIEQLEHQFVQRAFKHWHTRSRIDVLGGMDNPRLSIISLQIKNKGRVLHHGFVTALLNDLFGIQVRGGCSCAGPYGHGLLGITAEQSEALKLSIGLGNGILKPGWVRLNFNYFINDETFEYLLAALDYVAEYGDQLQNEYRFDASSGVWSYHGQKNTAQLSLADVDYSQGAFFATPLPQHELKALSDYLDDAHVLIKSMSLSLPSNCGVELSPEAEALRWFSLPTDK